MAQMGGYKLTDFLDWILVYGPMKHIHGPLRGSLTLGESLVQTIRSYWRTQKIFMGVSFSGIWWSFAFGVHGL